MSDPLAPFEDDLLAAVADEHAVAEPRLREVLRELHTHVESLSGVDELVHDWRKGLPYDPLVARTDDAYYLVFMASVWEEFAAQLGWDERPLAAARAVHDRQARRDAARRGDSMEPYEGAAPMVLSRV